MDNIAGLKNITAWTAVSVALLVMLVLPVVFVITSMRYQGLWLDSQANLSADKISEIIYSHPDSWEYQHHRFIDILALNQSDITDIYYKIIDVNGEMIVESGKFPARPVQMTTEELHDGEKIVGTVMVAIGLQQVIYETLFVTLIGLVLAFMVYFSLRLLPFAALSKTTQSLIDSRKETEHALEQQKSISEKMRFQSLHDDLTGLPNRKNYIKTLDELIIKHTLNETPVWVVIIDLDRFKEINDALGHVLGDHVLVAVAERLTGAAPEDAMVARLGGDEYALLIPDRDKMQLEAFMQDLMTKLKAHIKTHGFHLSIDASLGIAQLPLDGHSQEDLMRHADIAMYHAKSSGVDWAYYDQDLKTNTPNRLKLTADLRSALDNNVIQVYFQPKISLKSSNVIGLEALARWQHPEFGFVSPDVFIPIAEQTSMINTLTEKVILMSLKALRELHENGYHELTMAVNISARNLQDERFCSQLASYLDAEGVSAEHVVLEVTETSIMYDPEQSYIVVKRLADMGLKIAIDDFGTGYSSLSYLKKLAASQVKIDRSFIKNLVVDRDDYVIVESTIKLAHSLGMEVVAEGVEDVQTNDMLTSMSCEFAQGYYYKPPIELSELMFWLEDNQQIRRIEKG